MHLHSNKKNMGGSCKCYNNNNNIFYFIEDSSSGLIILKLINNIHFPEFFFLLFFPKLSHVFAAYGKFFCNSLPLKTYGAKTCESFGKKKNLENEYY